MCISDGGDRYRDKEREREARNTRERPRDGEVWRRVLEPKISQPALTPLGL